MITNRFQEVSLTRLAGSGLAVLLTGCAISGGPTSRVQTTEVEAAFVVLGENGIAQARAITRRSTCPEIVIDGRAAPMSLRAAKGDIPQRTTASSANDSRPSQFPVNTCEFTIPVGTQTAVIGTQSLKLPVAKPTRIILLGDTGCRMKVAENTFQDCSDKNAWPFETIANRAAAMRPDLVIHVGDYHYRENNCPSNRPGCGGSPWGYGWDTWKADLFEPGAKLLAAAPWVVARGNHEECRRAGQGWFRFLDVRPFSELSSCNDAKNDDTGNFTDPYAVPVGNDFQVVVFDSAKVGPMPLKPDNPKDAVTFSTYQKQFRMVEKLAAKPGVSSMFLNHHPILGYEPDRKGSAHGGHLGLLSVMSSLRPRVYYPDGVKLAMHGHVHLFEAINFVTDHPATILSGIGGDDVSENLPDPFPPSVTHAQGTILESITHSSTFGFVLMERTDANWQIKAFDYRGNVMTSCVLTGSKIRCDKTGLIK